MTYKVYSSATKVGNVFKAADGTPLVQRIMLKDVATTVQWLESITGLSLADNLLGSAGKKTSSGDIDVAVDQSIISKDELASKLIAVSDKSSVKKSGISVHFKSPINGDRSNGYVQVDFMFVDNVEYAKFGLFSAGDSSKFTGAIRNFLLHHIAKSISTTWKFSWQRGLVVTNNNSIISNNPDEIAKILLGNSSSKEDANSVETIISSIKNNRIKVAYLTMLRDTSHNENDVDAIKSILDLISTQQLPA